MSINNRGSSCKPTFMQRFCSNPRVQNTINQSKKVMGNALDKYSYGVSVTKANAKDTIGEMGKLFSAKEAKAAYFYTKGLAKEAHEDLVGHRVRLFSDTFKTVFQAQANSLFNRNHFNIDNSAENDSEDDE